MPRPLSGKRAQSAEQYEVLCARWKELSDSSPSDTEAAAELKQIRDRLRAINRCPHNCVIVEIDVPEHSASTPLKRVGFRIGNAAQVRDYRGPTVVPRCIAHELLRMISEDRKVDRQRMMARETAIHETGRISDIARQVANS